MGESIVRTNITLVNGYNTTNVYLSATNTKLYLQLAEKNNNSLSRYEKRKAKKYFKFLYMLSYSIVYIVPNVHLKHI